MILSCGSLFAQKVKTVSAEYTFYVPETMSVEEAKRTALDRAKIQAIADEFGTIVSQSTSIVISTKNGESDSQFFAIGGSDVKGEWIETIGEPKYDIDGSDPRLLVVTCKVTGKAREIVSAKIDFIAKPLRNGTELKFESTEFRNGDYLYMFFQSPASGYLMIYLVDEPSELVYCILPYKKSDGTPKKIESDKEYILFSQKFSEPQERRFVDEYEMTCNKEKEYNDVYILFSEEPFSKMLMSGEFDYKFPITSNLRDFQKWLSRARITNPKLILQKIPIVIYNK